jgi:hypothetical protein
MTSVADIDSFLKAPKVLLGQPEWVEDPSRARAQLIAPVGVVGGALSSARVTASVSLTARPQNGSVTLLFEDVVVQRMGLFGDHRHVNPFGQGPQSLQGITFTPGRCLLHSWQNNRRWPRSPGDNCRTAATLPIEPARIDEALTIFLSLCAIDATLPPAPWRPTLL